MSRPGVCVKRVSDDLERSFTELWMSSRVESGVSPEVAARAASEGKVRSALQREDVRAFVALGEGGLPVGFVVATHSPFSGLTDSPSVAIDQLYVAPKARRHGVARHLLAAVTAYAEKQGCEQIGCNVPSQQRDANRFFARLGFSSQVVRRVTSTSALRRRLGADEPRISLDQILHKRRSLRARASAGASRLAG
ncbi:GNAT family N-acetyltransferase [Knoellia sp. p5-6-4]|uniref:GNAT family N-acetyltransferase n=1 Tax=unclassified Knoellia TaxID=2618719 RepID=UPI0023DBEE59|nr:GNAT family N-acetyltransferase [Knoellia sp. p5-6-4]MDF2145789.1 GNAT family N-acetyltransferase [Knoellia sp. p5-6-4]